MPAPSNKSAKIEKQMLLTFMTAPPLWSEYPRLGPSIDALNFMTAFFQSGDSSADRAREGLHSSLWCSKVDLWLQRLCSRQCIRRSLGFIGPSIQLIQQMVCRDVARVQLHGVLGLVDAIPYAVLLRQHFAKTIMGLPIASIEANRRLVFSPRLVQLTRLEERPC